MLRNTCRHSQAQHLQHCTQEVPSPTDLTEAPGGLHVTNETFLHHKVVARLASAPECTAAAWRGRRSWPPVQSLAHLVGDFLQAGQSEVELVPVVPVVLLELVQIGAQQLAHQEQVLLHTVQVSAAEWLGIPTYVLARAQRSGSEKHLQAALHLLHQNKRSVPVYHRLQGISKCCFAATKLSDICTTAR